MKPTRADGNPSGFRGNIERLTVNNGKYRKILHTDRYQQLVLMAVPVGGDIPWETHNGSQFIRVESGRGTAEFLGRRHRLSDGVAVVIPLEPDTMSKTQETHH